MVRIGSVLISSRVRVSVCGRCVLVACLCVSALSPSVQAVCMVLWRCGCILFPFVCRCVAVCACIVGASQLHPAVLRCVSACRVASTVLKHAASIDLDPIAEDDLDSLLAPGRSFMGSSSASDDGFPTSASKPSRQYDSKPALHSLLDDPSARSVRVATVHLVDLAGSERVGKSGARDVRIDFRVWSW